MLGGARKGALLVMLCFIFFGCDMLVKQLYVSVPPLVTADTVPVELEGSVSTAYALPNPDDGASAVLTVTLTASGSGAARLYLPSGAEIEQGKSVATFMMSVSYDGATAPDEVVTITARAFGYEEGSATMTIILP